MVARLVVICVVATVASAWGIAVRESAVSGFLIPLTALYLGVVVAGVALWRQL